MSRIIKNSDLVLSHTRIIDIPIMLSLEKDEETEEDEIIPEPPAISQLELEKEEISKLRQESAQILSETEQMVMDLLERARNEAKTIITNAQEDSDVIRTQVFEEARLLREQATVQGYQEGLKKAQTESEADRQMALEQSQRIIAEAHNTKIEMINSTETDIVRLVMAIAKKIIASELLINPQTITNIVRQAISNLDSPDNIRVYVNPDNIDTLLAAIQLEGLNEIGSHDIGIELKADSRVSPGGCIVDSNSGSVDAQLETRIGKVEEAVLENVNE